MKVADFNRMTDEKASTVMVNCCGASRWVRGMLAGRPYSGLTALLARADREWRDTGPDDWKEAFAHHPRLGETRTETPVGEAARMRCTAWRGVRTALRSSRGRAVEACSSRR